MLAFCFQRNIGVCADLFCGRHSVKWCLTSAIIDPRACVRLTRWATQTANRRVVMHCTTQATAVVPSLPLAMHWLRAVLIAVSQ
jgi:hypothetical protein